MVLGTPKIFFQIYRPINDRWQAIFVLVSVLMGKRPKNGQKLTIFKNGLKTHPFLGNVGLIKVVSEIFFGHPKYRFWPRKDGHFCQKCPYSGGREA